MIQNFPFGRRLLLFGVIGLVLSITGATASALEELDIDGKEDLWKGAHEIRLHTDFKCGDMKAKFEAEMNKQIGVRVVKVSVNGMRVPATLREKMQDEIKSIGRFDNVYFMCAGDKYSFSFTKWEPNKPEPIQIDVSGRLKDLEP